MRFLGDFLFLGLGCSRSRDGWLLSRGTVGIVIYYTCIGTEAYWVQEGYDTAGSVVDCLAEQRQRNHCRKEKT